jgi:broad specificity phosphatase PhoE
MQTTVFLIRHGESNYNREGRIQGDSDFAKLTEHGVVQSELLKKRLDKERFDAMYSSPLRRAMESSHIVRPKGMDILIDEDLKERNFGELEGKIWEHMEEQRPDVYNEYRVSKGLSGVKGAEGSEELQKRAWTCFREIVKENQGEKILVVTHGGFIAVIMSTITNTPLNLRGRFSSKNGSITVINYSDENNVFKVERFNDTSHLETEM